MTKICDFPQHISDLTKNSMPYLWLDPLINTYLINTQITSYLVQTDVNTTVKGFC